MSSCDLEPQKINASFILSVLVILQYVSLETSVLICTTKIQYVSTQCIMKFPLWFRIISGLGI